MITGPQCRAARVLIELSRQRISKLSGVSVDVMTAFEAGMLDPGEDAKKRLQQALEECGAVFIPESKNEGLGVRLKFNRREARAVKKLEDEGGIAGDDDV